MPKQSPAPIDKYIGHQLRLLRAWRDISRDEVAKHLNISHQQVEKYEKGTNRISAGTLLRIAQYFDVPINFFFESFEAVGAIDDEMLEFYRFLSTAEGKELALSFLAIRDKRARKRIVDLMKSLKGRP